jgi:dolichol-phosphate mannosyltransferase
LSQPIPATPSIVVVIPTYNERENIRSLIPRLLESNSQISVIVVDDNSPDGTGALLEELSRSSDGRVKVVHRSRKAGIGPAYLAGFRLARQLGPDLIATMDADHSHDPSDLPRLIDAAANADLVLGSRYVPGGRTQGWPIYRRSISRIGGIYARLVLGVRITDLTGGFKVYRMAALEALELDSIESDGYVFQIETTYRTLRRGFQVVEVPITFVDRVAGKSKLSRRIVAEAILVVWKLRFDRNI